jgi:flagellar basal-body rod protein FlgB
MPAMDISSIPLFEAITRRMGWLTQRQTVLAENVANVNTPGYDEKDLKEPDFRELVQGAQSVVHLAATQPGHITTRPGGHIDGTIQTTTDRTLNGNGISVEAQMMKVSENAADYTLTTTLYKKHIALIKMALGGSGGG